MKHVFSRVPQSVELVHSPFRYIKTEIPAPGTAELLERLEKVESRSMHGQLPIIWSKAEDYNVFDLGGNKYIDFTSTIFVASVGHSNKRVCESIAKSIELPLLSCYTYAHKNRVDYLERLINFVGPPFEKAFLLSAGTESTDAAIKLMRMKAQRDFGKKKRYIISVEGNWHGRTLGAQLLSSNALQKEWIAIDEAGVSHLPFPYPWVCGEESGKNFAEQTLAALAQSGIDLKRDVAGLMLESFQGWGALFYPKTYILSLVSAFREAGALICFDEMQAGFGRTGLKFGYQHYDVSPDLICCGKAMGGGVPVSAIVGKGEIMDLPDVGNMSSTHSANPLACAAGIAVLDEIEDRNLVTQSHLKGTLLAELLNGIRNEFPTQIKHISSRGLIAAVIFNEETVPVQLVSKIVEMCMKRGVLVVHTGRESIKLGPPLTIPENAIIEGIEVLKSSIFDVLMENKL